MASNISVRLSVDGEQKFKKAMKDAAKSVNDVDSRLKLATAEFKKNGDAQKLMQTRTKTLNEEIKRQTQIVEALEDALQTTEQKYGENSTQALAYEAQLNRARQKLVQMETALDNNAKGLDENGKAFDESGKKAEKAAVSFTDLHHAIENVQNAAKNAATHVINFAKGAWDAMSGASDYADNLLTLSTQTGLSVEQLQKYAMAAGLVDTEATAIYTAIARMVNPTGEMATALEQLGVNTREIIGTQNFTGAMKNYVKDTDLADTKARNALDVFWDTIDALKRLSDQGKDVDELTKSIFGKSFADMKPLIDKGKAGWEEAGDTLNNVASQETVEKLGAFNDSLQELKAEFEGLQTEVLGQLAPGFTKIADSLTGLLERFGEWAKSPEGQTALKNLSDSIAGIVSGLGEEDFESLITTATGIISKLADAINSITNDPSGIINAVKGALIGYATLSVSKEVLSLLTLLRSLGGSGIAGNIGGVFGKLGNLFGGGGGGGASSAGGSGLSMATLPVKIVNTAEVAMLLAAGVESAIRMGKEVTENHSLLGVDLDMFWPKDKQLSTHPKAWYEHLTDGLNHWNEQAVELGKWADSKMLELGNWVVGLFGGGDGSSSGAEEEYRDSMTGMTQQEIDAAKKTFEEVGAVTTEVAAGASEAADAVGDMNAEYEKFAEMWRNIGMPEEEIKQLYESIQEQGALVVEGVGETGANAGGALAAGLLSSLPSIAGAVSRINAVVATIGGGAPSAGLGGRTSASSYTRNNSIYINNLNQSNAADIYDTLRNMNGAQEHMNRGWGYVPA